MRSTDKAQAILHRALQDAVEGTREQHLVWSREYPEARRRMERSLRRGAVAARTLLRPLLREGACGVFIISVRHESGVRYESFLRLAPGADRYPVVEIEEPILIDWG